MSNPLRPNSGQLAIPFIVRNGVLVPSWYASSPEVQEESEKPAFLQFSITTAGWRDSIPNGEPPTLDAVIARLSRYSLRQICFMISRISIALQSRPRESISVVQDEIVDNHLGAGSAMRLRRNVQNSLGHEYDS